MDYHLIVRYNNFKKWETSFSSSVHPEIEGYLSEKGINELEHLTLNIENIKKLVFSIEKSLVLYFKTDYEHKEYSKFRPKCIKEIEFKGEKYNLKLTTPQLKSIRLFNILSKVISNNGDIVLYGKKYLEFRLLQILNVINNEKIENTKKLIERIEAVKHPNFNVFEGLLELERKEFVKMNKNKIIPTQKGKI